MGSAIPESGRVANCGVRNPHGGSGQQDYGYGGQNYDQASPYGGSGSGYAGMP
ncbi:hypothetical protein IMZ48_46715 [Candidatus Bathyarchaeota archaeon]|nr:hypothetical protein [Candidatus Bathyarchaeota archaeon]